MSGIPPLYSRLFTEPEEIRAFTDSYFNNSRACVEADGESQVKYATFIRTPSMFAPEMAIGYMKEVARKGGFEIAFETPHAVGDIVPAGQAQFYMSGPLSHLLPTETFLNQKVGATSVAAFNAFNGCKHLPNVPFIAMGARHCVGEQMQEMMDYAASVGGNAARAQFNAKGFINGASDATAHFFNQENGAGTTPHVLFGYYGGSALKTAQRYKQHCPDKRFTFLVDFKGQEITDAIELCTNFPKEAYEGTLGARLDTHGGRYLEGLDHEKSMAVIQENCPDLMKQNWSEDDLKIIYGRGVSVAAVWYFNNEVAKAGFPNMQVLGSSGFNERKCEIMGLANAPLDGVGTGSYIPKDFHATYATSDVFEYDGERRIKVGREYLADEYYKLKQAQELRPL